MFVSVNPILFQAIWLFSIIAAALLAGDKRGLAGIAVGLVLGLTLGPIGAIVAVLLPRTPKREAAYRRAVERELGIRGWSER